MLGIAAAHGCDPEGLLTAHDPLEVAVRTVVAQEAVKAGAERDDRLAVKIVNRYGQARKGG